MRLRRKGTSDGSVPLADLIRRISALGVFVEPFQDDAYLFQRGDTVEVHFLEDPVPFLMVRNLADRFKIERIRLYFDRSERDLH